VVRASFWCLLVRLMWIGSLSLVVVAAERAEAEAVLVV
jgi:hypothetical protein